jgi:hypothetical protein
MPLFTIRHHYACAWPYGSGKTTGDKTTYAAISPIAFATKAERDAWVKAGPAFRTDAGYREAIILRRLPYGWSRNAFLTMAESRSDFAL